MDEAGGVRGGEPASGRRRASRRSRASCAAPCASQPRSVVAADVLHRDVHAIVDGRDLEHVDDVGVRELGHRDGLALQTLARRRARRGAA